GYTGAPSFPTRRSADLELVDRALLALEVLLGDLVVDVGQRLEQTLARLGGGVGQLGGDLLDGVVLAHLGLAAPGQRTHPDQVDDADEVRLRPDRELQDQRRGAEAPTEGLDEIGRASW